MEDGSRRTDDGVQVVTRARDAFVQLGTAVETMAARIGAIAGEVAASAQEPSSTAEALAAAVSRFRLAP